MRCNLAESWYGQQLNLELLLDRRSYGPTQREEGFTGFDSTLFTTSSTFWRLWPIPILFPFPRGVSLDPYLLGHLQDYLDDPNFLKFKFNLFLQYKRPEFISSNRPTNEYQYWRRPYFRYKIVKRQQKLLSTFEMKIGNDALVVYACPTLCSKKELWNSMLNSTLIEDSNFAKPSTLIGHKKYTFVRGGRFGKGFSEKEEIPVTDLNKEIKRLFKMKRRYEKNSQFIKELANDIDDVIKKLDEKMQNDYNAMTENVRKFDNSFYHNFSKIFSFLIIADLSWLIGYER